LFLARFIRHLTANLIVTNAGACRGARLHRLLLFLEEMRVDDCGLLLLTVFVFMLIFLKWAAVARPRSQIVLPHVFADVA
jgi:hypothetical protein